MERRAAVFYQICLDRPGDPPFDGTGVLYEHVSEALRHLQAIRDIRPHAYLAIVTFERYQTTKLSSREVARMCIDPECAIPFEEVLANVWERNPELHEEAKRVAQEQGLTVEELAWRAEQDGIHRLLSDGEKRSRYQQETDRRLFPYGFDPLSRQSRSQ